MGLADNSKTKIKVNLQETDKRYKIISNNRAGSSQGTDTDPPTGTAHFGGNDKAHSFQNLRDNKAFGAIM